MSEVPRNVMFTLQLQNMGHREMHNEPPEYA